MKKEIEIWKEINGYKGLYEISNLGRVKSLSCNTTKKEKVLKNRTGKDYYDVALYKNKQPKPKLVHRLMAIEFLPNPENKPCINHIDGNKRNNTLDNLEWCTHSENMIHSFRTGLQKPQWAGKLGKENKMYKIVEQYTNEGIFIRSFFGGAEASRITGIAQPYISMACRGKRNSDKNFKWKFAS